jgi:hypothetical protein
MKKRNPRQSLFNGYWFALVDGELKATTERATHAQLTEAYRLWAVHKDIREGVVGAGVAEPRSGDAAGIARQGSLHPLRERHSWHERNPFHEELQ